MQNRFVVSRRRAVLAFASVIALSTPLWAQRPPIRRATMYTIKPDHRAEFESAVKEYNAIYAKIPGAKARTMFQSLSGPNQFVLTLDYEKWSDLDPGDVSKAVAANSDLARIVGRINGCIESGTSLVEGVVPALSMPTSPDTPPKMIRLARNRIVPSKTAEWEKVVQNELLPAYLKAGAKSFTVRRVHFGAPANEYYISTRLDNWAGVDNGLQKSMGDAAYNAMVAKLSALTVEREVNMYRFREELSFSPARAVSGTK